MPCCFWPSIESNVFQSQSNTLASLSKQDCWFELVMKAVAVCKIGNLLSGSRLGCILSISALITDKQIISRQLQSNDRSGKLFCSLV